ncbi:MAG: HAMP domain-containing sensor histidine kinase [Patescibacteria group bacterium]
MYWKRFAGLVTDSAYNYRTDPFFRTEVNVVVLQGAFALFLLAVVGVIATQLYHDASTAVTEGIANALTPNSSPASVGDTIIAQLDYTRSRTVIVALTSVLFVTAVFTYIITRMALQPTRKALESQKQFIGNVAHELRTPLSIIKTNTEVRLMDSDVPEAARTVYRENLEELDRISETINNLLSLSASIRPERMEFKDVDLGTVVHGALQKLHPLAQPKRLEIEARMSERKTVLGNTAALEQITMNIIKNAIIYTPRDGRILVTVEPVYPDFMEFVVQDSGVGIPRKDLFRIFEPYYRVDPSRARGAGGSGLGLTIVSELVKLHGGKITVRSAERRGTTVTVLLPAGHIAPGARSSGSPRGGENVSEVAVDFSHNLRRNGTG